VTGAGNEAIVEGNTDMVEVAQAAVTTAAKSAPLGAILGAAGAGPVVEAVAGEVSTVVDAGIQYVAEPLKETLAPELDDEREQ
jgi:hypothetical protein